MYISLSIYIYIYLYVYLSICLSIYLNPPTYFLIYFTPGPLPRILPADAAGPDVQLELQRAPAPAGDLHGGAGPVRHLSRGALHLQHGHARLQSPLPRVGQCSPVPTFKREIASKFTNRRSDYRTGNRVVSFQFEFTATFVIG